MYIQISQWKSHLCCYINITMQLTKHTDYAFRVLIYLAGMSEKQTTIQHITEKFSISKTHVMKIVNKLSNNGWVVATRGKNGGISLGVNANSINLRQIVELMEKTLNPISCSTPLCYIKGVCQLKPILLDAQSAYLNHLEQFTLADLMDMPTQQRLNAAIHLPVH